MQPPAQTASAAPRPPGALGLAAVALAAFQALMYRHGASSRVLVHDNLDGEFVNQLVFARSEALFAASDALFWPLLGGMPRGFMPGELFLPMLVYRALSPFAAVVLLDGFIRTVALVGMWRLVSRHVLPNRPPALLALAALGFALLPFYPNYGVSVAGYPLLASAWLDLAGNRARTGALCTLALYPFVSSFALAGIFVLPLAGLFWLYALRARLPGARYVFAGGAVFLLSTLVVEWRMFASVLGGAVASQRSEFVVRGASLREALGTALTNLLQGQYHADAVHGPLLLPLAAVLVALSFTRGPSPAASFTRRLGLGLVASAVGVSLWYGLWDWELTRAALAATGSKALQQIALDRLHWLHPTLWSLVGALALDALRARFRHGARLAVALAVAQCLLCVRANLMRAETRGAPFAAFYAEPLFDAVRNEIGRAPGSYRVVSLGLFPSVAMFNGFHVADGYHSMYPLTHKHAFREVIAAELGCDEAIRRYFDEWGSRCYVFSAELGLGTMVRASEPPRQVETLRLDPAAMLALGAPYLLSAVELSAPQASGLRLRRRFEDPAALWRIWLYEVIGAQPPGDATWRPDPGCP